MAIATTRHDDGYRTRFGSLEDFEKGGVAVIDDDPRNYVFSNVYEVASNAEPFEKVAVATTQDYVLEAIRVEGTSPWRASSHDEFALVMSGEVAFDFLDPEPPVASLPEQGSVELGGDPAGHDMGQVVARRGHLVLLPAGSGYRYRSEQVGVLLLQTIASADTRFRWAEICQTH